MSSREDQAARGTAEFADAGSRQAGPVHVPVKLPLNLASVVLLKYAPSAHLGSCWILWINVVKLKPKPCHSQVVSTARKLLVRQQHRNSQKTDEQQRATYHISLGNLHRKPYLPRASAACMHKTCAAMTGNNLCMLHIVLHLPNLLRNCSVLLAGSASHTPPKVSSTRSRSPASAATPL